MVWKHQLKTPRKKTSSECLLPPLYLILWVSAPMESLAFQAAECESDRPQYACQQKSRHHHQNYSNWAAAGDSSSCLLPIGPENQNTGVALCLGSVSAAQRNGIDCQGFMDTAGFSSRVLCADRNPIFWGWLTRKRRCRRALVRIKRGVHVFFRWRQHWNHDKQWFSSTK